MKILLAVSGGIDSMYMANRAPELFPGALLAVAHCNFHLRGKDSDDDEAFVRGWCADKGIPCFVKDFDTENYCKGKGISIEMGARELRYSWFNQVLAEEGYDAVAVAHNADDNAETLFLNLLRGTGTRGIRGMSSDKVLRPLLGIPRCEILDWMNSRGLQWRTDKTNAENKYKRNRIRNEVFPVLKQINPSFIQTLGEDMRRFAQVDDIAEDYFQNAVRKLGLSDSRSIIPLSQLTELKHWKYVLFRLLESTETSEDQFNRLCEAIEQGRQIAGKTFGAVTGASDSLLIGWTPAEEHFEIEHLKREDIPSLKQNAGVLIMDEDKLPHPLVIREWKAGDWMQPFGMRGRRKLSDIFVDLKWSLPQKNSARVIELEGSHVAALICEKIDDSVKVTDSSVNIVRISRKG